MTRDLTWRAWLVLSLFAVTTMFLAGAPFAQACDHDDGDYDERYDDFDDDEDEYGGNHGGAGATQVPVVDDDFAFMVVWTRERLQADAAHVHATGAGVTVAVLDGGFNLSHPAIRDRLSPFGYDAIDRDGDPEELGNGDDDDGDGITDNGVGHGTFVSGMILLAAPEATILPIRVRDDEGWGFNRELERGLVYAWNAGVDIVNISGAAAEDDYSDVRRLIADMRADGILVVVSAGNDGMDGLPELPAEPTTLVVGSTDRDDDLANFSNFGPTPDGVLLAPGVDLYGSLGSPFDAASGYWSGTSFSAGLVSGAAALVLQARPWLTPRQVHMQLLSTADLAFDSNGNPLPDAGRINLNRAVTE